jgi:hypothetical protein
MSDINSTIDKVNISHLSLKDFKSSYLLANKPVIITNIFEGTAPLASWTPEYLIEKLGNRVVRVNTSSSTTFFLDPKKGGFFIPPLEMGFKDYINKIRSPRNTQILYMQQLSIIRELQELKPYFILPKYINSPQQSIDEIGLWVSPGGNTSPLHYDLDNNFFIQSYGFKKFLLYTPWEFYNLYPNSLFSKAPHTSKIDLSNPDMKKYPNFLRVKPKEIIIAPGEMLFLPAYWWHQVYSIDLTISINIWWPPLRRQCLVPGSLHFFLHTWYYAVRNFITKN